MTPTPESILQRLSYPFKPNEVRWKPKAPKNGRALAMPYVDPRKVMQRLDEVVGCENWKDRYTVLPTGGVICRLYIRLAGEWIYREGAGSVSKQADAGDSLKAGFSYALRNAAMRWGIARYLYSCPAIWTDYDESKKCFTMVPQLPVGFLPNAERQPQTPQAAAPKQETPASVPAVKPAPAPQADKPKTTAAPTLPKDGAELKRRLDDKIARLLGEGYPAIANLIPHLEAKGKQYGPLLTWGKEAIEWAAKEVGWFEAHMKEEETQECLSGDMEQELRDLFEKTGRTLPALTKHLFKKALKWDELRVSHWRALCGEMTKMLPAAAA